METTIRKITEDKMSKWFPIVLIVTLLLLTVLAILWSCLVGLSPYNPERWICINNFDENFTTLDNDNATFSIPTKKANATQEIPNDFGIILYGPKKLNDPWCADLNMNHYPLVDWSCDAEKIVMKYSENDIGNNSNGTSLNKLQIEGQSAEISNLCAVIDDVPPIHKIPIAVAVLVLIWGIFLLIVSKMDFEGTTMTKVLQLMALLRLAIILINVITYIESERYQTLLLVLLILDICVFVVFIQSIFAHRIRQTEEVESIELEMTEMRIAGQGTK